MPDSDLNDEIGLHLHYVGLLCTQWSYLERMLEYTHWWILGLLNKPKEGRIITGSLSIEMLAKRARDLAHLKIKSEADIEILQASGVTNRRYLGRQELGGSWR